MSIGELQEALRRLYLVPDQIGEVPDEIMTLLRMLLHERNETSERIARFLREMVKL